MLKRGLVQIYTGEGKGKTTTAIGLAVRAAGAGNKILFYQFLKPSSLELSERKALAVLSDSITIRSLDVEWDMQKSFKDAETVAAVKQAISQTLKEIAITAKNGSYDCIIIDEIIFCISKGLAKFDDIKKIIAEKDDHVEIVMTGRGATDELVELADLVTEMKNIKHPFTKGTCARRGIEF